MSPDPVHDAHAIITYFSDTIKELGKENSDLRERIEDLESEILELECDKRELVANQRD